MKRRPNLRNLFYLMGSGFVIQLAGTIYRIWLARKIGPEGLGILQMIYPVYRLLSGLATIGLPLALTKWTAEYLAARQYQELTSLKNWAANIVFWTSLLMGGVLFLSAPLLSRHVFSDSRVQEALLIVAFAIPFSALSAIYRGYFQGLSAMSPTAVSEITEQIAEVGFTVCGIIFLISMLPISIFSFPVAGLTLGEVACLLTLLVFLKMKRPPRSLDTPETDVLVPRGQIFRYSWPLLLNQVVTSVSFASEGVIIPHLLISSGLPSHLSTGVFGNLTGMAEPVAYFPLIFLAPLGSVLSPQVSAAYKTGTMSKIRHKFPIFYLTCTAICIICFLAILLGADTISRILYGNMSPVYLIRLLVIGLPFTGLAVLNINTLVAVGATDKILLISLWAMGLKTFALFVFIPLYGITGAVWAINTTQIFILTASWFEVRRYLPWSGG